MVSTDLKSNIREEVYNVFFLWMRWRTQGFWADAKGSRQKCGSLDLRKPLSVLIPGLMCCHRGWLVWEKQVINKRYTLSMSRKFRAGLVKLLMLDVGEKKKKRERKQSQGSVSVMVSRELLFIPLIVYCLESLNTEVVYATSWAEKYTPWLE